LQSGQDEAQVSSKEQELKEKQIGKILGLLEESHKNKDWIAKEAKKQGLSISISQEMNAYEILSSCAPGFIKGLLDTLYGQDITIPDGIQTKTYHWFFSDIVAGSNPSISTNAQVKKIIVLNDLISKTAAFRQRDPASTILLPTGDGMAIGFGDSPEKPVLLSIELHKMLSKYNKTKRGKEKLLLRIGVESGQVYFVKDLEGKNNVWGPGIILTRRVMDLCGDMQIFAANRVVEELLKISPKYKEMLHFVENYETMHGEKIQLFNIYGDGFGLKAMPKKEKKTDSDTANMPKASSAFSFNAIKIYLDVMDVKTMKTRHTWIWNITNESREPRTKVFYFIDGQVPKDFSKLNVRVAQKDGKKLKIDRLSADKKLRKEFYVRLDKPIQPKQSTQLTLEYDWEEPERSFTYRFPSKLKRFDYVCTLPRNIDIKSRILKIDPDTGKKVHANPPPIVKRIGDRIAITWEKSNILAQDAYQFEW